MWEKFAQIFRIPELRKRIVFTLGVLVVFRLGTHIALPGVDAEGLRAFFAEGIFGFLDMFVGGALGRFSLFALGVGPYINASIIMSLLVPIIPKLKELQQQGREGQRRINKYTRYGTLGLAVVQSIGICALVVGQGLAPATTWFYLTSILTLTTGTMLLMWIGERITENGIGNGISMLIMVGIIAEFPRQFYAVYTEVILGVVHPIWAIMMVAVMVALIAGIVIVQQGRRKIIIQYAKRTSGRRIYGGHSSHLPIRVNQGGVIPVIFATALLSIPVTMIQFVPALDWLAPYVEMGSIPYMIVFVLMIFFFTYFYSSITFDPNDVAKNIRESGGFIPGVRPGNPSAAHISAILSRILVVGALFLAAIAVFPFIFADISGIRGFLVGGIGLLIVVGVGLDTLMQIEAHLTMRHYESITKGGALLGRRR